MTVGGLFDGCGLLAYGLHLAGWEHRWLCEIDEFRQRILRLRFPGVPIYPDVRAVGFDAPRVDLIAGGFPCKGASSLGPRTGFDHPETALWREMRRAIRDLEPRFVLVENVADLLSIHDGAVFGEVLGDLAALGYDAEWDCFPAAAFGAPHGRDRVFLTAVAHTDRARTDTDTAAGRSWGAASEHDLGAPADAARLGERGEDAEADALSGSGPARTLPPSGDPAAAAVSGGERRTALPDPDSERGLEQAARAAGRGVEVDWREYEPAIRRWEELVGRRAPEPLVRRVDDGDARRVERSRLSALGDGVLVQAGWLVGRRILDYERSAA